MADKPKFDPTKPFEPVQASPTTAPVAAKPKFNPTQPFKPVDAQPPGVLDEASDIGVLDRLAVKNFGGKPEDQVAYLRESRPDLDIRIINNEIVAKKPTDAQYRKLDPGDAIPGKGFDAGLGSGGILSKAKEGLSDLGDIAFDTLAGGASTAAGAAGAIAGAPTGIGAIPAAMGASGTAGTAMEGLRQAIGNYLRTAKGADVQQMALTGGISGLAPGLFGAGASEKAIAKAASQPGFVAGILKKTNAGFLPKGATPSAKQAATAGAHFADMQTGMIPKVWNGVKSILSGVPKETLSTATEEVAPTYVKRLVNAGLELDPNGKYTNQEIAVALKQQNRLGEQGAATALDIVDTFSKHQKAIGKQMEDAAAGSPAKISISPLGDELRKIAESTDGSQSEPIQDIGSAAKTLIARFFEPAKKKVDAGAAPAMQYLDLMGNPIAPKAEAAKPLELNLKEAMQLRNTMSHFINDRISPASLESMGPEAQQLRGQMMAARDTLQDQIYNEVEKTSAPGLRSAYKQLKDFERNLQPKFSDAQTAARTLSNLNNKSNAVVKEQLGKFDKQYGTDILGAAKLSDVTKFFGDPSLEAMSGGGVTSTSRTLKAGGIGRSIGDAATALTGIPGLGRIGSSAAEMGMSPAMVAKGLQAKTNMSRLLNKTGATSIADFLANQVAKTGYRSQAIAPTVWNAMQNGGQEK